MLWQKTQNLLGVWQRQTRQFTQQKLSQNTQNTQNGMEMKARKHSHAMAEYAELGRGLATTNTTIHNRGSRRIRRIRKTE